MSVNVVLTRLEESGSAALQNSHAVFFFVVEMCHNTTSLCACMFACHIQSELRRVEVSVTGVGAHERVASFGCAAAGGRGNMCMCAFFGGRAGRGVIYQRGTSLPCNIPLPLLTSQFD